MSHIFHYDDIAGMNSISYGYDNLESIKLEVKSRENEKLLRLSLDSMI